MRVTLAAVVLLSGAVLFAAFSPQYVERSNERAV
jgi:hypothetical protein